MEKHFVNPSGVVALFMDEVLIDVEAIAVVD